MSVPVYVLLYLCFFLCFSVSVSLCMFIIYLYVCIWNQCLRTNELFTFLTCGLGSCTDMGYPRAQSWWPLTTNRAKGNKWKCCLYLIFLIFKSGVSYFCTVLTDNVVFCNQSNFLVVHREVPLISEPPDILDPQEQVKQVSHPNSLISLFFSSSLPWAVKPACWWLMGFAHVCSGLSKVEPHRGREESRLLSRLLASPSPLDSPCPTTTLPWPGSAAVALSHPLSLFILDVFARELRHRMLPLCMCSGAIRETELEGTPWLCEPTKAKLPRNMEK